MDISANLYRQAFDAYLRKGTPIDLSLKQARPTTHYIWRTRNDGKVRPSHAANDGEFFAWDERPPTGHPGEDYGCRCTAEPYYSDDNESISHIMNDNSSTAPRRDNGDFLHHFFLGESSFVTLSEIGHLEEVANHWAYGLGRLEAWNEQIFDEARKIDDGEFHAEFERSYDFGSVQYSHGGSVVKGKFVGSVEMKKGEILKIDGTTDY